MDLVDQLSSSGRIMLRSVSFALVLVFLAGLIFANESFLHTSDDEATRKKLWSQFEQDQSRNLPKSAIEKLERIEASAISDEDWPDATLAFCSRLLIEGQIDQPVYPYVIKKLDAAISESPEQMRPLLNAMLADYVYQYYLQNQWRFQQRSQTASVPGDDIEAWDLATILGEIDKRFTTALESADQLKQIPIGDYSKRGFSDLCRCR